MNNDVNHPNHYTWHSKIECKDVAGEFNYNIGTAIAYLWRCGHKHNQPAEDLNKAIQHIRFELERIGAIEHSERCADEVSAAVDKAVRLEQSRLMEGMS